MERFRNEIAGYFGEGVLTEEEAGALNRKLDGTLGSAPDGQDLAPAH